MRAIVWHRHAEQEDRTAARALPANQYGQCRDASRRAGIPGRAGGAAHAAVRGPARDRAAIAGRRTSGTRAEGRSAAGSRAFAFVLTALCTSSIKGASRSFDHGVL